MANYTIESSFDVSVGTVTASTITVASLVGAGVPSGGTANQILEKINSTDYNTQWVVKPTSYPSADATKVGYLTVTQAVDLDTMESDIATNNAKVTNQTHTGDVTGSVALSIANDVVDDNHLAQKFKGRGTISALDVDWDDEQVQTKTLGTNSVLTFSNLYIGVKDLEITGNYTLGFPANFKVITGTYDGSVANLIEIICTDTSTPAGWITISQEA